LREKGFDVLSPWELAFFDHLSDSFMWGGRFLRANRFWRLAMKEAAAFMLKSDIVCFLPYKEDSCKFRYYS